jgi:hypothetical protein
MTPINPDQQTEQLKLAIGEIRLILQKYDCAAVIALQSPDRSEYSYELSPSWCAMTLSPEGFLHVRCKTKDYASQAEQKRALEITVGTLAGFEALAQKLQEDMQKILVAIGGKMTIEHISKRI